MTDIASLAARLRNLFSPADFQKRYGDGKIQVKTYNGRVIEKMESFPYGFFAKAKKGKVLVFCQGGNLDGVEVLPVRAARDVTIPELQEGDAALYSDAAGRVVCRVGGTVELNGKDNGGVIKAQDLKTELNKLTARVDGIMNALKNSATAVQDGGAAYKTQIVTALSMLQDKENFSGIESEKVLHGNG
jgi:phage gp45-like